MSNILNKHKRSGIVMCQILDYLLNAVSHHRWKDSQIILPLKIICMNSSMSDIWNILQNIMEHKNIPSSIQAKCWQLVIQYYICGGGHFNISESMLPMLSFALKNTSHHDIQESFQKLQVSTNSEYKTIEAYVIIKKYLEWNNENSVKLCHDKTSLKAYCVEKVNFFKSLRSQALQINKKNDDQPFSKFEWLLMPLLHVGLSPAPKCTSESMLNEIDQIKTDALAFLSQYVADRPKHLPALLLYYDTICKYKCKKNERLNILQRIIEMSPDNRLVLVYVKLLLKKKDFDLKTLFKCLDLLCSMVEFDQWRNGVEPWRTMCRLLLLLHKALIKCYSCSKCQEAKELLKEQRHRLSLWPHLFWKVGSFKKGTTLDNIESELYIYHSYTAFIFGFEEGRKLIELAQERFSPTGDEFITVYYLSTMLNEARNTTVEEEEEECASVAAAICDGATSSDDEDATPYVRDLYLYLAKLRKETMICPFSGFVPFSRSKTVCIEFMPNVKSSIRLFEHDFKNSKETEIKKNRKRSRSFSYSSSPSKKKKRST